jgi:hypothetical protein
MGMLKRRLLQEENADHVGVDDVLEGELSDDSTTSEEESVAEEDFEETKMEQSTEQDKLAKTKIMILASRGVNARYKILLTGLITLFVVNVT